MDRERELHLEVLYWRQLLERVATDLESLAARESEARRRARLAARAMRIRRRLHEGMPDDFQLAPASGPLPSFDGIDGEHMSPAGVDGTLARRQLGAWSIR